MAETAIYYDGLTARRQAVTVALAPEGVELAAPGLAPVRWAYGDLRRRDAPEGMLRLGTAAGPPLAAVEIRDAALAAEIVRRAPALDAAGTPSHARWRIAVLATLAAVSLVLTVVYIVPQVAERLAPLVPRRLEARLGDAVDRQVRAIFVDKTCEGGPGGAALDALVARLDAAAGLQPGPQVRVLDTPVTNAIALPGGRIYLFAGMLQKAENVDEIAGVLAHEMGHVAHRDGLRVLLQSGGSSFLLGLLFGDVAGSSTVIFMARMLTQTSYSRQAETAADGFAAQVMAKLGRSPRALGTLLERLTGHEDAGPLSFLRTHPLTAARVAALRDAATSGEPVLAPAEWDALKGICRR